MAMTTALVCAAREAHAQFDPKDLRAGFELNALLGGAAFTNRAAFRVEGTSTTGNMDGALSFQGTIAYRVIPPFSVGLSVGLGLFLSNLASADTESSANATRVGFVARVHPFGFIPYRPVWKLLNLYVGTGYDFFTQTALRVRSVSTGILTETLTINTGGGLPLHVGFDVEVTPGIDVGAMFLWTVWRSNESCVETPLSRSCDRLVREPEGFFFGGVGVRVHGNPFAPTKK
jgi:hypothetical protein